MSSIETFLSNEFKETPKNIQTLEKIIFILKSYKNKYQLELDNLRIEQEKKIQTTLLIWCPVEDNLLPFTFFKSKNPENLDLYQSDLGKYLEQGSIVNLMCIHGKFSIISNVEDYLEKIKIFENIIEDKIIFNESKKIIKYLRHKSGNDYMFYLNNIEVDYYARQYCLFDI